MSTSRIPILVTGGCGFLGTEIVSALLSTLRYDITVIDINPPSLGNATFTLHVRYVRANVLDREALDKVFSEAAPALVVHTVGVYRLGAARYSMKGKEAEFQVNVEGTRNVVEAAKACGARGLVYTSSVTVVLDELGRDFRNVDEEWPTGRATTSYGQSKPSAVCDNILDIISDSAAGVPIALEFHLSQATLLTTPQALAESLVLSATTASHSFTTCSLRLSPILGPHDPTVIPRLHACIPSFQTPFDLGSSSTALQDYIYVSNAADAHVLAVSNLLGPQTAAGEAFFITNGQPVPLRHICLAVWREFGHVPKFTVRLPEGLAWCMGLGAEGWAWLTGMETGLSCGIVDDACRQRYVSIIKARRLLGYRPKVGLDEGIRISCEWYKGVLARREVRKEGGGWS